MAGLLGDQVEDDEAQVAVGEEAREVAAAAAAEHPALAGPATRVAVGPVPSAWIAAHRAAMGADAEGVEGIGAEEGRETGMHGFDSISI
ncbi:E3 ubiquitin-protein ligase [Methylobacterium sp. ME121]|nr:E3 ubiquitin-protein ligase [Methylobacterium sp. ME121]GEM97643.1 hypothetical protein MRA01_21830 [Methylobacterium radiotolerans]